MKTLLPILFFVSVTASAQITTPIVKAGFGVDADLRGRYFNGALQNGNDDWFMYPGTTGNLGEAVIDTTGAAAMVAAYTSDVSPWPKRSQSFYRTMSRPQFSVVNNRLWLDALYVRDYHGNDTTVFTSGSDKNGMSPVSWTSGIQGIPDKNDILDMFMHVRRAGPNRTDSLWFLGGISLDNTTGNRYFDFEMYQTDIYYDRASGKWFGYGPDAGHTTWGFDAAGNVTKPGDIIFSAEYQSSTLTNIEARIWINKNSLSITPAGFSWSGKFDGASSGAQYGYASILPKAGGTFYTGIGSGNRTWAGAFQLVLQDNSLTTDYARDQFMEFSVNLTKLGLDPVTTFGGDVCGTPFNRLVVKTRSSASFTAELKDFIAPTDLFLAPRAKALADVPLFCGVIGVSNLQVQNPSPSSVYTWSTTNGNIVGSNTGDSIIVNAPGTYMVTQRLAAGCNVYASDTLAIVYDATCVPMAAKAVGLKASIKNKTAYLNWTTKANNETEYFEIQRSENGLDFQTVGKLMSIQPQPEKDYSFNEDVWNITSNTIYYRLKIKMHSGAFNYSGVAKLDLKKDQKEVEIFPNPVNDVLRMSVPSQARQQASVSVFNISGSLLTTSKFNLNEGINILQLDASAWNTGAYVVQVSAAGQNTWKKFLVNRSASNK